MTNLDSSDRSRHVELGTLRRLLHSGSISRREFTTRAAAMGLAAPAVGWMLRAYGASAHSVAVNSHVDARFQDSASNPITVTVGGTPIAST